MPITREWKVTIGGQIEEVANDPRFPALFEAALTSDPEVNMIQFGEPTKPRAASAVILISAVDLSAALALGQDIPSRNFHVVARAIFGDKPYRWALQVEAKLLSPLSR